MNDPAEEAEQKKLEEGYKLGFETAKQLTTLNAGSIVVIGTFLSDIFPSKNGVVDVGAGIKTLIALSFVSFGISLLTAIWTMNMYANALAYGEDYVRTHELMGKILIGRVLLGAFVTGLLCFSVAVVLNL